ncbi:MAG: hypothetical protein KJ941_04045 [Bacteroidetes bacterium]|nr:hypothetical protein [Bacteroidota bacterium]
MKNLLATFAFLLFVLPAFSQSGKKELKKEVSVEEVNGVKKLKVTTTENGKTTIENFEGAAADQKLEELQKESEEMKKKMATKKMTVEKQGSSSKTTENIEKGKTKEVRMEEKDGVKTLTVKTVENGLEKIEVYKGQEAEEKLKQIESEKTPEGTKKTQTKVIKQIHE